MKLLNSFIIGVCLLAAPVFSQSNLADLNTFSVGLRAVHLYDLPSYKFDNSISQDLSGLNGEFTKLDVGIDVYAEKQFTPLIGVQGGIRIGSMSGSNDVEHYRNQFISGNADLIFILSNLDRKRVDARFNYYAKLGLGYGNYQSERFLNADMSSNGGISDNYWETRIGAGVQYELTQNLRLDLDVAYNMAHDDGFDGFDNASGNDTYLSTGIGIAYTFGNKEHKPMYSINFFGEEYAGAMAAAPIAEFDASQEIKLQAFMDEMVAYKEHIDSVTAWQTAFFDDLSARMEAQDSLIAEQSRALSDQAQANSEMQEAIIAQQQKMTQIEDLAALMQDPEYIATLNMISGKSNLAVASSSPDAAPPATIEQEDIFEAGTITASLESAPEVSKPAGSIEMTALFGFDSDDLDAEYKEELKGQLDATRVDKITLVGYADAVGPKEYNQKLKSRRAQAVRQFLIHEMGIEPEDIEVELAPDQPDLGDENYLNRKVVIKS